MKIMDARKYRITVMTLLSVAMVLIATSLQTVSAQQKDGDSSSNSGSTEPRGRVNFNIIQLMNGEYLEMFGTGTGHGILRGHPTISGVELGTLSSDPILFSTNSTERMRLLANGFLGLGIKDPIAPLEVGFADAGTYSPTGSSPARIRLVNTNATNNNSFEIDLGSYDTNNGISTGVRLAGIFTSHTPGAASADFAIGMRSAGAFFENTRFTSSGRVGIGTSTPAYKLDVAGNIRSSSGGFVFPDGTIQTTAATGGGVSSQWVSNGNSIFYNLGNVGIGTVNPPTRLHVIGDGRFTGNLTVDGNIAAKYQDLAEWVPATEQFSAGTVVILDPAKSNQITSSTTSYDTRVAGIVSENPGITLGEKGTGKVLVATTGRVRVKVDTVNGPIRIGDLLVTSEREGYAMKSLPLEIGGARLHRPGTLIGKALEALDHGTGEILLLLSLQ